MTYSCSFSLPVVVAIDDAQDPRALYMGTLVYLLELPFAPAPGHAFMIEAGGGGKEPFDVLISPVEMVWYSEDQYFDIAGAEMVFSSEKAASSFIKKAVMHGWEMDAEDEDEDGA